MRLIFLLVFMFLFKGIFAQSKPIDELPTVDPIEVGFSQDSLNALDDLISNHEQRDYRALIVIKNDQLAIEYYYNSFWRNHIHDIRKEL